MGILRSKKQPVYITTDGREFASGNDAAEVQVKLSLQDMQINGRFENNPGTGGHWDWFAVKNFIASNREELRILLEGVQPKEATREDG